MNNLRTNIRLKSAIESIRLPKVVYIGWLCFGVSMSFPSVEINHGLLSGALFFGWQATFWSLVAMLTFYKDLVSAYFAILGFSNIIFFSSIVILPLLKKGKCRWYPSIMFAATLIMASQLIYFNDINGRLYLGYYFFLLGYMLVSTGAVMLRKQLATK